MPQTPEATAFLDRVARSNLLDDVLAPSLEDEAQLRRLFATDKDNARLKNPFVGLVDVYDAPDAIRKTHARIVKNEEDLAAKYVMPLTDEQRRKDGEPCMAENYDEFLKNFAIFTGATCYLSAGQLD